MACLIACLFLNTGCKGDNEFEPEYPIIVNGIETESNRIEVPKEGGVYAMRLKDYGPIDILLIRSSFDFEYEGTLDPSKWTTHLDGGWFNTRYDEQGNFIVTILPNDKDAPTRYLSIEYLINNDYGGFIHIHQK